MGYNNTLFARDIVKVNEKEMVFYGYWIDSASRY